MQSGNFFKYFPIFSGNYLKYLSLNSRPYLEKHDQWNEETEDAWRELFGHITRVMTHAHIHYVPTTSTLSEQSIEVHS